jgi:ligand-binding sensor domain-containing protein
LGDIERFEEKVFFVLSNSVFIYDHENNRVSSLNWEDGTFDDLMKKNQVDIASRSVSRTFSRNNNLYIVTDLGIIDYKDGSLIVPSATYFNYKITDLIVVDSSVLFLSTTRGLFIVDLEENELINYYDFPFLRNIYQMKYTSEYLVLLTSKGLIKFNINL